MSCADVQTIQAGNGAKTQFSFDFPYIFKSEIQVSFWNATTKEWDVIAQNNATYPWQVTDANPTIVEFTGTAPPAPAVPVDPNETAVDNVKIRRVTNIDDIRALFNPGSAIRSDDLNKNFEQLRYAIQEANCQGIPDDVDQYLKDYYWDRFDNTLYSADTWRSDDATIATTAALDQRFQDEVNDTFTKAELASNSNAMPNNDDAVPTTGAVNDYINEVITNDIGTDGTGITVTDDGDGTITLGLADNSIDFSKIKDADIITQAEQDADYDLTGDDNSIFTSSAAVRRFENFVQNNAPSGTGIGKGRVWVDPDDDLTLSVWNGTNWVGITSGGTFTNQPKVVYVDASSGDDANDGHRISRPKKTIKAAINQVNADAVYGDGSVIVVAPGTYQEVAPLDITKKDVSIIGTALRSCVIHPTVGTETNSLFRVNSGTFLQNLTFTGVKASGTRGEAGSIDPDAVYGLPGTQGWNVSFYPGAMIYKSPYIQNCTNFSDSEIDNSSLDPHTPAGGAAGDTDSQMTGGGLLIDGSVVDASSPLRSMVCDSYTHVGLDGPGILVTNNGYAQCTSSYAFFNHYHIKALNGGQANLAASTTDFGRYGLVVDGRSTNAIFTADTTATANDGDTSFTIDTPVAGSPWHGSATRPQSNMLVDIGGNTYPILSATPNGAGWDVVISRPDPGDRSVNLGLDGAVASGSPVSFYLRSMIASSGHTMEYVGSGTNYAALPENGGVPVEANQVVELNNGKIWTATTDHNGKFKVGNFFTVDQQTNAIFISSGSFNVDLQNLQVNPSGNAVIGANLDLNGSDILDSTGNVTIADTLDMNSNAIINVQAPTSGSDAANKTYVDTKLSLAGGTMTGALGVTAGSAASPSVFISADTNTGIYSPGADQVAISTNGAQRATIDSSGRLLVGTASAVNSSYTGGSIQLRDDAGGTVVFKRNDGVSTNSLGILEFQSSFGRAALINAVNDGAHSGSSTPGAITFQTTPAGTFGAPQERLRITSDGKVGLGSSAPGQQMVVRGSQPFLEIRDSRNKTWSAEEVFSGILFGTDDDTFTNDPQAFIKVVHTRAGTGHSSADAGLTFGTSASTTTPATERMRIDSSGNVGIGVTGPQAPLHIRATAGASNDRGLIIQDTTTGNGGEAWLSFKTQQSTDDERIKGAIVYQNKGSGYGVGNLLFCLDNGEDNANVTTGRERARLTSDGKLLIGTSSDFTGSPLQVINSGGGEITLGRNDATVNANDDLGHIFFAANDTGTGAGTYASISCFADSTHSGGPASAPTRLEFSTTVGGSSTPTERMRIDSQGRVGIGTASPTDLLNLEFTNNNSVTAEGLYINNINNGAGNNASIAFSLDSGRRKKGAISLVKTQASYGAGDLVFSLDGGDSGTLNVSTDEKMRLTNSGQLLVGTSSARAVASTTIKPTVQVEDSNSLQYSAVQNTNDIYGPAFVFGKTRGTTAGAVTIVQSGDELGTLYFTGADGTDLATTGATIAAKVDGTPGVNDLPTRLVFSTTADGASSPTERMRITSDGYFKASNNGGYAATSGYHEVRQTANEQTIIISATNASYTENLVLGRVTRAATSAYNFAILQSSFNGDSEFVLRGDGNAYADGSWNGGGADYAEYFEWNDGNPDAEDRRGISVVLDGNKIRPAVDGEDPIGVISGNPSVVGDAAWNKWNGKYLRDDYGSYVLNENGERQLNPAYDPDVEYISRENRCEWDCVGLMGKLRLRKGQPTGSRWIKMRNISDSVEEWLVH